MIKTQEKTVKTFQQNSLYIDALVLHLIHKGYKRELAELKVKRMIKGQNE